MCFRASCLRPLGVRRPEEFRFRGTRFSSSVSPPVRTARRDGGDGEHRAPARGRVRRSHGDEPLRPRRDHGRRGPEEQGAPARITENVADSVSRDRIGAGAQRERRTGQPRQAGAGVLALEEGVRPVQSRAHDPERAPHAAVH